MSDAHPRFWCDLHLELTLSDSESSWQQVIEAPCAVIGSHRRATVRMPSDEVEGREYYIHATEDGIYCVPLTSSKEVRPAGWLQPGETLPVGPYHVEVVRIRKGQRLATGPTEGLPELAKYGSTPSPLPQLSIRQKSKELLSRRARALLTIIGRSEPSLIRIPSASLSNCHCALFWQERKLWAIDLASTNRILLDGRKGRVHLVPKGSVIRLGEFHLTFEGLVKDTRQAKDEPPEAFHEPPQAPTETVRDFTPHVDEDNASDLPIAFASPISDSQVASGSDLPLAVPASTISQTSLQEEGADEEDEPQALELNELQLQLKNTRRELDKAKHQLKDASDQSDLLALAEEELSQVKAEMFSLQQRLEERDNSDEADSAEINNLRQQLTELQSSYDALEQDQQSQQKSLTDVQVERDSLQEQLVSLRDELAHQQNDWSSQQDTFESQKGEFAELKQQLSTKESELTALQENHATALAQLQAKSDQQESEHKAKLDELGQLQQDHRELLDETHRLRDQLQKTQSNVSDTEKARDETNHELNQATELSEFLQQELDLSRKSLDEKRSELTAAQSELAQRQSEWDKQRADAEDKLAQEKLKLVSLQERQSDFEKTTEALKQTQNELAEAEKKHQAELQRSEQERKELEELLLTSQAEVESLQRLESDIATLNKQLEESEQQKSTLVSTSAALEVELESLRKELAKWSEKQATWESEKSEVDKSFAEHKSKLEKQTGKLHEELRSAQADLKDRDDQIEQLNKLYSELESKHGETVQLLTEIESHGDAWKSDQQQLEERLAALQSERDQLELDKQRLTDESNQAAQYVEQIKELESTTLALQQELASLHDQLATQKQSAVESQQRLQQRDAQAETDREKLATEFGREKEELQTEIVLLREELKHKVDESAKRSSDWQQEKAAIEAKATTDLEQLKQQLSMIQSERDQAEAASQKLASEQTALADKLASLEKRLADSQLTAQTERRELESLVEEIHAEKERLSEENAALRQSHNELAEQSSHAQKQHANNETDLGDLRSSLDRMSQANERLQQELEKRDEAYQVKLKELKKQADQQQKQLLRERKAWEEEKSQLESFYGQQIGSGGSPSDSRWKTSKTQEPKRTKAKSNKAANSNKSTATKGANSSAPAAVGVKQAVAPQVEKPKGRARSEEDLKVLEEMATSLATFGRTKRRETRSLWKSFLVVAFWMFAIGSVVGLSYLVFRNLV